MFSIILNCAEKQGCKRGVLKRGEKMVVRYEEGRKNRSLGDFVVLAESEDECADEDF